MVNVPEPTVPKEYLVSGHTSKPTNKVVLKRTVYPAGFGAFCSEQFQDANNTSVLDVVYDCGSKHSAQKTQMQKYINDDYLTHNRTVDVLFVSHFHDDHVNCIKHLPLRKDTLIVLPYIFDEYQLLFEFIHRFQYTAFLLWLQENGYDNVILVDPYEPSVHKGRKGIKYVEGEPPARSDEYTNARIDSRYRHIKPFDFFHFQAFDWIYTPFHLQDKSLYRNFLQYALANGFIEGDFIAYDGKDDAQNKRIRDLYKHFCNQDNAAKQSLNASSMLLVSSPYDVKMWRVTRKRYRLPFLQPYAKVGLMNACCLYTGDTPLSTAKYEKEFLQVNGRIMPDGASLVQLPHHGSIEGYNNILYQLTNCIAIFVNCYELAQSRKGEPALYTKAVLDAGRSNLAFFAISEEVDTRFDMFIEMT